MIQLFSEFINEHKLHKTQIQFLDYIEKLSKNKVFVFTDTETTGLGGPKKQQLTQVSAVAYNYNYIQNTFDAEKRDIIVEYESIESLVNDGWRLD